MKTATPRTMEQAFGPYERHGLEDPALKWTTAEVVVYSVVWVIVGALATLSFLTWILGGHLGP